MSRYNPTYEKYKRNPDTRRRLKERNFTGDDAVVVDGEIYFKGECIKVSGKWYKLEECIGKGGFASVWKARDIDWNVVGLKVFRLAPDERTLSAIVGNLDVHRSITDQRVQKILEFQRDTRVAVVNFLEGVPFLDYLLDVKQLARFPLSLIVASECVDMWDQLIFDHEIIHQDFKLENLLVDNGDILTLRLSMVDPDLITRFDKDVELERVAGTPVYLSPMRCCGCHDWAGDLYSTGIIVDRMILDSNRTLTDSKSQDEGAFTLACDLDLSFQEGRSFRGRTSTQLERDVKDMQELLKSTANNGHDTTMLRVVCDEAIKSLEGMDGLSQEVVTTMTRVVDHVYEVVKKLTSYKPHDREMPIQDILGGFNKEELLWLTRVVNRAVTETQR